MARRDRLARWWSRSSTTGSVRCPTAAGPPTTATSSCHTKPRTGRSSRQSRSVSPCSRRFGTRPRSGPGERFGRCTRPTRRHAADAASRGGLSTTLRTASTTRRASSAADSQPTDRRPRRPPRRTCASGVHGAVTGVTQVATDQSSPPVSRCRRARAASGRRPRAHRPPARSSHRQSRRL